MEHKLTQKTHRTYKTSGTSPSTWTQGTWTQGGGACSGGVWRLGFTIIELMVAITLLSIITGIVFASFASVVQTSDRARIAAAELRLREFMTRSLTVNLTQAYGDWLPGAALRDAVLIEGGTDANQDAALAEEELMMARYVFQGENDVGPLGLPADMLTFSSTAPLIGNLALPGFLKQVTYEIVSETGEEDAPAFGAPAFGAPDQYSASFLTLEVTETPIMGDQQQEEAGFLTGSDVREKLDEAAREVGYESPGWRVPMRSLDIHYFDGEEWVEEWDSLEMGRLPWSVRIRMNFARPEEELEAEQDAGFSVEEDPDYELVVAIPAGLGITLDPPEYVRSDPATRGRQDGGSGFGAGGGRQDSGTQNRQGGISPRRPPTVAGGRRL